ncbi:MAG: isochorismatase family protein [Pseudonocardiaceae bacterium]
MNPSPTPREAVPGEGTNRRARRRGWSVQAAAKAVAHNLDFILRGKGIKTTVHGGFPTNCCVESKIRTGYEHGYQVVTLADWLAARALEQHNNAIAYDFPMFCQPTMSGGFIGELK